MGMGAIILGLRIGDRVTDALEGFRGKLLGPSGSVSDTTTTGETEMVLWAVENPNTHEVRHLRADRLVVRY
jgi:hypothetical protein